MLSPLMKELRVVVEEVVFEILAHSVVDFVVVE